MYFFLAQLLCNRNRIVVLIKLKTLSFSYNKEILKLMQDQHSSVKIHLFDSL